MKQTDAADRVAINPVGAAHVSALANLHASLFPDAPWDSASFKELLAHPGAVAFVARTGRPRAVVGFIVGWLAADEAEILTLGVARPWQRAGIGSLLVETFCRAAKVKGVLQLHLEVAAGNAAARALYARFGFQETGRRRGYYAHAGAPADDAINLCLTLAPPWWRPGGRPRGPHL